MTALEHVQALTPDQKRYVLAWMDATALMDDCKIRTFMELYLYGITGLNSRTDDDIVKEFSEAVNDNDIAKLIIANLNI